MKKDKLPNEAEPAAPAFVPASKEIPEVPSTMDAPVKLETFEHDHPCGEGSPCAGGLGQADA